MKVILIAKVKGEPSEGVTALAYQGKFQGASIDTVLLTGIGAASQGDELLTLIDIENIETGVIHGHAIKWRNLS